MDFEEFEIKNELDFQEYKRNIKRLCFIWSMLLDKEDRIDIMTELLKSSDILNKGDIVLEHLDNSSKYLIVNFKEVNNRKK